MQQITNPGTGDAAPASPLPIRIRLLWHPQPQFAGYLVAAHQQLGAAEGVALHCQPMQPGTGPIEALLAGDAEFAVASPAHMLESGHAEELVMLLAIQQASALVYPARIVDGITTLTDLHGKSIAVWPGHEELELRWMLHRAGIEGDAIHWLPTGDTVTALTSHAASCAQMTLYHELHALEHEAGSLKDFVIFAPGDDTALLKDGLIARRAWVEANPQATQSAINAILAGWHIAFTDAPTTLRICRTARPDMDEPAQSAQLAAIRALALQGATLTHGLGYPEEKFLHRAQEALAQTQSLHAQGAIDSRFWQAAPAEIRSRSW